MSLNAKLELIEQKTTRAFDNEKYDIDAFQEMTFEIPNINDIPNEMLEQTPLAEFKKDIEEVMKESGLEYKLEFVSLTATCDGGCFEPCYCLCWYDKGIHTKVFHFSTVY